MNDKKVPKTAINKLEPLLSYKGSNDEKVDLISAFLKDSKIGMEGVEELKTVLNQVERLGLENGG